MAEFVFPDLQSTLTFVFIIVVSVFLVNVLYWVFRKFLDARIGTAKSKSLSRLLQYTIFIGLFFYGFNRVLNLDVASLAASLGILSIAVAFSAQQFIQNAIAGIIITTRKILSIEDWIDYNNTGIAQVRDITLTHTVIRNINSQLIYISNSSLLNQSLVNYTKSGITAVEIDVSTLASENHQKLKKICEEVAHEHPLILPNVSKKEKQKVRSIFKLPDVKEMLGVGTKQKLDPQVLYREIAFGRARLFARVWISDINEKDKIVSEYYERLFAKLKKAKMKIL